MRAINVAVVGALGAVGREMIKILEESELQIDNFKPLDTEENAGKTVNFRGMTREVEMAQVGAFVDVDIAFFSAGATASKVFAPIAVDEGAVVIDNSSAWRMVQDVPLVIPEVNPEALKNHQGLIANPNCSTIQMLVALKPLHDKYGIKRIVVSTYQAVSGSGAAALKELRDQSLAFLNGQEINHLVYPHQIAFNAVPQIDVFTENGYTKEEMKMVNETHKILDPSIRVCPTAVRIPVFRSHSESINVEFNQPCDAEEVRGILARAEGVQLLDDPQKQDYPLAIFAEGKDKVYVGRVRKDLSCENGINLWIVADNLRKGAALNAVQIAEKLMEMNLLDSRPVRELL